MYKDYYDKKKKQLSSAFHYISLNEDTELMMQEVIIP